jgi:DNA-binding CsgD family transcriptional regulator
MGVLLGVRSVSEPVAIGITVEREPRAVHIPLAPLSASATRDLLSSGLQRAPGPKFAARFFELTGGNPLLVTELADELATKEVEPDDDSRGRLDGLVSAGIAENVRRRLLEVGESGVAVARAIAVLGPGVAIGEAADLAQVDIDTAGASADALTTVHLLSDEAPLAFAHPLVAHAVYEQIPRHERGLWHGRAARVLERAHASGERLAAQLLRTPPNRDPWVVETLRAAAIDARRRSGTSAAVEYLRRALAEPPPEELRASVLAELGIAERHSDDRAAAGHLGEALAVTQEPRDRAVLVLELARALILSGRAAEAAALLQRRNDEIFEVDREVALECESELLAALRATPGGGRDLPRLTRWESLDGETPGERALLAALATEAAARGDPADVVVALAERALGDGRLLAEQSSVAVPYYFVSFVFVYYDRIGRARQLYDAALDRARREGSPAGVSQASAWRSCCGVFGSSLADAAVDAQVVLDLAAEHGETFLSQTFAPAVIAYVQLEQGDPASALTELERRGLGGAVPEAGPWNLLLYVRGRCRAALGDIVGALEDVLAAGRALSASGVVTPAGAPWRSQAGMLEIMLGKSGSGRARIEEELTLARELGVPRTLGVALGARARLDDGKRRRKRLEEAVDVLRDSESRLDLARALVLLGSELRRVGQRRAAREPLAEALSLADELGASACARQAHEELVVAGARPRRAARHGLRSLTASELRVAQVAAAGASNREIADDLFLSLKTVEMHLTRAYSKLEIQRRAQLAAALHAEKAVSQ